MRGLTLRRPWAWAICHAGKRIENRVWRPPASAIGGPIWIHAGVGEDPVGSAWIARQTGLVVPTASEWPGGRIVAQALLHAVVTASDDAWFGGPYGWVLADVELLSGPPCRGRLGLWRVPAAQPMV